jgi:NDP-sugar pyrophosphorylase family protein
VNSGVAIARRDLLERIPDGAADLPADVYVPLVEKGEALYAVALTGHRWAVDSAARLDEVRDAVRRGLLAGAPNEPVMR